MKLPAALFVLLLHATVAAQTPSRATVITAAIDIIQKAHYCTFITVDANGQPQARIVDPIAPDADFTIWFATNPLTRKVDQVRRNPKVTLSCFDAETSSYVTLLGRGSLVTDVSEKQRHWKNEWAAIYPNGAKGDDFMLIRIAPARLEVVSESRGLVGDAKTWLPLTIDFIEQRELMVIDTVKQLSARELDRSLPQKLSELAGAAARVR
jgi:general stress protein 26